MTEGGALPFGAYPVYSVDTSALIDFRLRYPEVIFPTMWEFIRGLASDSRLMIAEAVDEECHDAELRDLINECPGMVVSFGAYQAHFARLMAEADKLDLLLIDPADPTTNAGDPHVVALALMLGRREPTDLGTQVDPEVQCIVVTHERRRHPGAKLAKIPDVCEHYALAHLDWLELLAQESFTA